MNPTQHTQQPIVTGTSVLGIKYATGVMIATDTLASYGSLAQIRDMKRIALYPDCIIGAGGDMSDWQHIQEFLRKQYVKEYYQGGGMKAKHVYSLLGRLLYERRSKNDPLWNSLVIGGYDKAGFLGYVDYQGTTYESETIATGYGAYIAQPILRKQCEGKNLTEEQAKKVMDDCLRVLFYRDARSLNNVQVAVIDANGTRITEPYKLETEWGFADSIRGYGAVYE